MSAEQNRSAGLDELRNVGIVAHIDAGKTTVSERILFASGVEHRAGQVDEGTTVLDWMAEERERGITIVAAATRLPWAECAINLVDTPGHVDFTVEVERCMRVLDGAVLVVDAVAGVQAQSETIWRQMSRHSVASVAFINKCDRPGADYLAAVESLKERLGAPALPVQYPVFEAGTMAGAIDLIDNELLRFRSEGQRVVREPLPSELADEVGVLRAELIEELAEQDDLCLEAVLEGREPQRNDLRAALRRRTLAGSLVPALCGVALRHVGVEPLLDAIVEYLPSPLDLPPAEGADPDTGVRLERSADVEEPLAALVFKVQADTHGDLCYARIYSGSLVSGAKLLNPRTGKTERAQRILRMHANDRQSLETAEAGDIVALTGLGEVSTGDTLCALSEPILLEPLAFPEPVIAMVVEPLATEDREKLGEALARLAREDPTLVVDEDDATGQWRVSGMGELHLEVTRKRLEREFKVATRVGAPRVAYREAPSRKARGRGVVDRLLGGREVYAEVEVEVAPSSIDEGSPVIFEVQPSPELRAAVERALDVGSQLGPNFGFPLVGTEVRLRHLGTHPEKDPLPAVENAAQVALREALADADVRLFEPVMSFEIEAPDEFAGGLLADLSGRRASVAGVELDGELRQIRGTVALAQMFGYSTVARSLTQGRASFSMAPAGFGEVPAAELEARGLVWS